MRGRELLFSHLASDLASWQDGKRRGVSKALCLISAEASRNGDGDDGGYRTRSEVPRGQWTDAWFGSSKSTNLSFTRIRKIYLRDSQFHLVIFSFFGAIRYLSPQSSIPCNIPAGLYDFNHSNGMGISQGISSDRWTFSSSFSVIAFRN